MNYIMFASYSLWVILLISLGGILIKKPVRKDKIISNNFWIVLLLIISFVIFVQAFMVMTGVFPRNTITEIVELVASVVIIALLIINLSMKHPAMELKKKKKELAKKQKSEKSTTIQIPEMSEEDELLNIEIDNQLNAMNGFLSSDEELEKQVEEEMKNFESEISEETKTEPKETTDEKIERLKKLREENILTEEEFKKLLLEELKK